jgi:hypothetical protein
MTTDEMSAVIFKDQAGEYYLLPQAVLERGRVPAEARAALEAQVPALQALGAADDDAQGHVVYAAAALGTAVTMLGFAIGRKFGGSDLGPLIRAYAGL